MDVERHRYKRIGTSDGNTIASPQKYTSATDRELPSFSYCLEIWVSEQEIDVIRKQTTSPTYFVSEEMHQNF